MLLKCRVQCGVRRSNVTCELHHIVLARTRLGVTHVWQVTLPHCVTLLLGAVAVTIWTLKHMARLSRHMSVTECTACCSHPA